MTFIIAEAGGNHGGSLETALQLVNAAKASGADAVKFQLFESRKLWGDDRIKGLELSRVQMSDIAAYCKACEIEFMCTPFGVEEVQFLVPLVKRMKVASGCLARFDLLEAISATGLPAILSTGMSTLYDIGLALGRLKLLGTTLMHCTSSYPCRLEDVNLRAMDNLRTAFSLPVGFSDHTNGITAAIAAAAKGAAIIEKHLTLDCNAEGPDHKASITPAEFKAMVMAIREVETALGDGKKRVLDCERPLRAAWHANA